MRKILIFAASLLASAAHGATGPTFGLAGGIGSSTSTKPCVNCEPTGGTFSINGVTGAAAFSKLNLVPNIPPTSPINGDCWTTILEHVCQAGGNTFGSVSSSYGNPTIAGGFFAPNDPNSLTNQSDTYTLTGTRNKAWIGRSIIVNDNATGPASGPATASYGLSIYQQRPNWNTSSVTGEMDGMNIVLRQANGDSAGILSNILTRNGFGATLESYTGTADATGAPTKAVNVQLGVSNSRDGSNYGLVVQSVLGTNLNAGVRINQTTGTSFTNALEITTDSGTLAYVRGTDGAFIGGSVVPLTNLGANLGAPTNRYDTGFLRNLSFDTQVFASLPSCPASAGYVGVIGDGQPFVQAGQPVTTGGGSSPTMVQCNGTGWQAVVGTPPASPGNCVNLMAYGADRTGTLPSDASWAAAVAATVPGQQCIYAPAGTYKFTSSKGITVNSAYPQASVTIKGDGAEATLFNFASGTSGIAVTVNSAFQSFHIRDLSILGGTYSTSTAGINVNQTASVTNPAYTALSDISNVTIRGNDGYAQANGFAVGVNVDQVSNINFLGGYISGHAPTNATCVHLSSATSNIGVVYNFTGMTFNACSIGIYYGNNTQGVSVSQSNFTGDTYGIVVPAGITGGAQLSVTGSQFNTYGTGIQLLTDPGGVSIVNNVFYVNGATGGGNAIQIAASQDDLISDNAFIGIGSNTNGINIGAYNRYKGLINANSFVTMTTGILLGSDSQFVTVGTNVFSSLTNNIVNNGTNNSVAVSCSAAPTSDFRVTNGVITSC